MEFVETLAHVMIKVSDLERSIAFYRDVLGFQEAFRIKRDDGTTGLIYMHVAGRQFVELSKGIEAEKASGRGVGYAHVCFEVADIQKAHERLLPSGAVVPESLKVGRDGSWQFWIVDPDGNRIELMQYTRESQQIKYLDSLGSE